MAFGVPNLLVRSERQALAMLEPVEPHGAPTPESSTSVTVQVLGGFAASMDGTDCTPPPGHAASLVKMLTVIGPMTIDAAVDLLWPTADSPTGRARLRNVLHRLRERSGPIVVRHRDSLQLHPEVTTDLAVFESQATRALSSSDDERVGHARHGLAMYTGQLLPTDVYEDWTAGPHRAA